MDEDAVRSLLDRLASVGAPPSSVDVGKARRVGLRRRRLWRLGAPTASLGAVAAAGGLLASGAVPFGLGSGSIAPTQATVRLSNAEVAVLTNSGDTPQAVAEASNAFQVVVKRCMAAKGLKFYPYFQAPVMPVFSGHRIFIHGYPGLAGVPQAPIGLAAREAHGYGFYDEAVGIIKPPPGGPPKEERYARSAGRKYVLALDGPETDRVSVKWLDMTTGAGGCFGVAARRVYGSIPDYALTGAGSSVLTGEWLSAVTADPAFATVVARWSACMAGRGFSYNSPEDLWNSLASQIDKTHHPRPALRGLEIRTAVADYGCAQAVRLLPTVMALQAHHARFYSKALAPHLAQLVRVDARALRVARALHIRLPRT
jgi:hypothetical protein